MSNTLQHPIDILQIELHKVREIRFELEKKMILKPATFYDQALTEIKLKEHYLQESIQILDFKGVSM